MRIHESRMQAYRALCSTICETRIDIRIDISREEKTVLKPVTTCRDFQKV